MTSSYSLIEKKAHLKLEEIKEIIRLDYEGKLGQSVGLYDGDFGALLFLCKLIELDDKLMPVVEYFSQKFTQKLLSTSNSLTFCSGLSGCLYILEYFQRQDIMEVEIDQSINFDKILLKKLEVEMANNHYDILHGALGIGLYFLNKGDSKIVNKIIDYLLESAEVDKNKNIYKWKSKLNREGEIGFNISLSHGIAGIVVFLSKLIKEKSNRESDLEKMLLGAINYIDSQRLDDNYYSFFPYQSKQNQSESRLAWCYGDLGVGICYWTAGCALNDVELKSKAIDILLASTKRTSFEQTQIEDAGICHGSAGVCLIFRRMYIETNISEFHEASLYWLERTLDFAEFDDGLAGYKTNMGGIWQKDYSLLTGISGIGLVLASVILDDDQKWDEILLLSI